MRWLAWGGVLVGLLVAQPAHAGFHLMKIVEVFGGTPASPNAQYVVLQMYSGGQNFVGGHSVIFYDAAGVETDRQTFSGSVANGLNQAKILIATMEAQTFFGVTPDLVMASPFITPAGGKVCFDAIDCVSWGNYTGPAAGTGTPFNAARGLEPTHAALRRLDIVAPATTLQNGDDTGDSANDFRLGGPRPTNN